MDRGQPRARPGGTREAGQKARGENSAFGDINTAGNGQNVLRSEGYSSDAAAKKGIAAVANYGTSTSSFDVLEASNGEWYTNLVAPNNEVIGTSQLYVTKSNATRGASTVRALLRLLGPTPSVTPAARIQRFEVFKGEDGKFYFHLRANNGEIVLASYDLTDSADGQVAFDLKASNGAVIATSETYVSASNATRAVQTCVKLLGQKLPVSE